MNYERPQDLFGGTEKLKLGKFSVYITVNYDDLGPAEIFCKIGFAGNDTQASNAAICQLASQALQEADDRAAALHQLKMTLRGIEGKSSGWNRGVFIKSIPDAIGWALEGYPDRDGNKIVPVKGNPDE